jgi:hypothetical protein
MPAINSVHEKFFSFRVLFSLSARDDDPREHEGAPLIVATDLALGLQLTGSVNRFGTAKVLVLFQRGPKSSNAATT